MRKLLLLGGLVAAAGAAYKKFVSRSGSGDSDAGWHSRDDSPSFGASSQTSGADEPAQDAAGASPDEAVADAVEEPHPVTTPDEPAQEVPVESDEK